VNPALGEDSRYSIALALGSIANFENADATAAKISRLIQEKCWTEHVHIKELLLEYWPTYQLLGDDCKDHWATAELVLRGLNFPGSADVACNRCSWVVESELQRKIIDGFRLAVPKELQSGSNSDDEILAKIFRPKPDLTFGQLLSTVVNKHRSRGPLQKRFDEWLTKEHPKLRIGLSLQPTGEIIQLRNRATQPNAWLSAHYLTRSCRTVAGLPEDPRSVSPLTWRSRATSSSAP
jgi:hypothetical protein